MRRLLSVAALLSVLVTIDAPASAQPRLEVGGGGSMALAAPAHRRPTPWGLMAGARVVWPQGRWALEVGADFRVAASDADYYLGLTWIRDPWVFRSRLLVAGRVDLFHGRSGALFGRVAAGAEHRLGRYDLITDEHGDEGRVGDHSGAFVLEPSLGGRWGAADRAHGVLVLAFPVAFHRKGAIRAHGSRDNELAADAQLTAHLVVPL